MFCTIHRQHSITLRRLAHIDSLMSEHEEDQPNE